MRQIRTFYSGKYIERAAELRVETAALARILAGPKARCLPVWKDRCLVRDDRAAMLKLRDLPGHPPDPERTIFLGRIGDEYLFAVALESGEEPRVGDGTEFAGLRDLTNRVRTDHAALLAYAKAMVGWQYRHRYCGICGSPCRPLEAGFVMACTTSDCGHRSFPRLDPAVIVLAHREDHCLLGRQTRWPDGRFSTIAGFVEPGESLEDAVRREVREEADVRIGACRYVGSQPWPFPAALMVGYHAEALSVKIRLNDGELAEARWVSREGIIDGEVVLPPRVSIAYRLIETWFDAGSPRPLESFGISTPPLIDPRR